MDILIGIGVVVGLSSIALTSFILFLLFVHWVIVELIGISSYDHPHKYTYRGISKEENEIYKKRQEQIAMNKE